MSNNFFSPKIVPFMR